MGVAQNQNIVRSGMIFCIDAQSKLCYPGSGSTVYNIANSAGRMRYLVAGQRSSTLQSGVTWTAGPPASFVFDGTSNAYMTWGTGADWFNNETSNTNGGRWDLAFEAWVKSSGMGSGMTLGGIFGWTYGVRVHFTTGGIINVGHDTGDTISGFGSGVAGQDGVWHHIVYTFGACGAKVYVDGVYRNQNTSMRWLGETRWSTNACNLGRDNNDAFYYLNGSIAVARIYHKFFTQQHVTQNFNADRRRFGV